MKIIKIKKDTFGKSKILLTIIMAFSLLLTLWSAITIAPTQYNVSAQTPGPLDPLSIPKFVNQLYGPPPIYVPTVGNEYAVDMVEFNQQILPPLNTTGAPLGPTKVWGYAGLAKDAISGTPLGYTNSTPGPSFEVTKGVPIRVNWTNLITTPQQFAVDPTLHWANPNNIPMEVTYTDFPPGYTGAQSPAPLVPHLHGGEVPPTSDGGPDAWWTSNGIQGPGYSTAIPTHNSSAIYDYPNINDPTTLWYHDHALGVTRLTVMSGLAGFYIVRNPTNDPTGDALPTGKYDMPLVFQDRAFLDDGSFNFPTVGIEPTVHPYWTPESFGDTIMVNGKVWPNMNVDNGTYRFRLLDGSNARFYTISFNVTSGPDTGLILPFTQIGSDGGYLTAPVPLTEFTFAPGERAEILVDFSGLADGTTILLQNTANENWPNGATIDWETVGQIMQFTITGGPGPAAPTLPTPLNPTLLTFPTLPSPGVTRALTLVEVLDPLSSNPLELLLDGQQWLTQAYEVAMVGDTEEWIVYNPTADSHPIHLHLVQFQVISRQKFNDLTGIDYYTAWLALNGDSLPLIAPTQNLANRTAYHTGPEDGPPPTEHGWKDTVMMNPGEVTKIRLRIAPTDAPTSGPGTPVPGVNPYPFDPTLAPGYVWHCHILDHEDNEMMRPFLFVIPEVPLGTIALLGSAGMAFIGFEGFKRRRSQQKRKEN